MFFGPICFSTDSLCQTIAFKDLSEKKIFEREKNSGKISLSRKVTSQLLPPRILVVEYPYDLVSWAYPEKITIVLNKNLCLNAKFIPFR